MVFANNLYSRVLRFKRHFSDGSSSTSTDSKYLLYTGKCLIILQMTTVHCYRYSTNSTQIDEEENQSLRLVCDWRSAVVRLGRPLAHLGLELFIVRKVTLQRFEIEKMYRFIALIQGTRSEWTFVFATKPTHSAAHGQPHDLERFSFYQLHSQLKCASGGYGIL